MGEDTDSNVPSLSVDSHVWTPVLVSHTSLSMRAPRRDSQNLKTTLDASGCPRARTATTPECVIVLIVRVTLSSSFKASLSTLTAMVWCTWVPSFDLGGVLSSVQVGRPAAGGMYI